VTFAKSRPSAVLVELDPPSAGQTRRTTAFAAAGMAILLAAYAAVGPGAQPTTTPIPVAPAVGSSAPLAPRTLALPANAADVELIAFPDWLANEPLPASFRAVVAIRGTTGLASVEGRTVVNWTEHGISYRLESIDRSIAELVVLADSLR
jgi:hypothetical protein